jgi:hypothetical protein
MRFREKSKPVSRSRLALSRVMFFVDRAARHARQVLRLAGRKAVE